MSNETTTIRSGYAPGTKIADRYRVVSRIGAGGMATVYVVEDLALEGERLALKLFNLQIADDASMVARFRQEVLITRKLSHPNIVRTFEFGELPNGCPYITMELIDGTNLEHLIRKRDDYGLSFRNSVEILINLLRGVSFAHQNGIVHRDLKSANVLIGKDGGVKVADFGLARSLDSKLHLTQSGECLGTPMYMAPEQIQGREVDARADIYALGIIAYELATGAFPYQSRSWFELSNEIVRSPIPKFASERDGIPQWFEEFVHRAGAKNPSDRFESVDEMLEILEAQISGIKPPRARRFPAAWQRAAIPTLASLALCLLVVVIGVASHQGPVPVAPNRVHPPQPPSSASIMQAKPPMVAPTAIAPLIEFVPMPMQQNSNRQPYPEDRDRYREQPRRDESMRRPMRPVERMKDPRRLREQFEERRPIFRDPRNR